MKLLMNGEDLKKSFGGSKMFEKVAWVLSQESFNLGVPKAMFWKWLLGNVM